MTPLETTLISLLLITALVALVCFRLFRAELSRAKGWRSDYTAAREQLRTVHDELRTTLNAPGQHLSAVERWVLCAMETERAYTFDALAEKIGVSVELVKLCVRALRLRGYAEFGTLSNDEGEKRGRGYWLSSAGYQLQRRITGRA